jgi:hypothetical protein
MKLRLNNDPIVLNVSNTKSVMGERRDERRSLREVVEFLDKRVPDGGERCMT